MATITDQMSSSNQHKRGVNGDAGKRTQHTFKEWFNYVVKLIE